MAERIEEKIKCPFFSSLVARRINCEAISEDMAAVSLYFESNVKRDGYIRDFCAAECMKGCPIYQLNQEKYQE